ncbi:MAG: Golgi transport complex subunit 6 [Bogoriella megaspora]|nr:MAG: Golgi transport complex subunit 6 [Bogoriella megaspora]
MALEAQVDRVLASSPDLATVSSAPGTAGGAQYGRSGAALSNRITSVLAGSYADLEIRDALETLDARGLVNNSETRRQLRLDVQRELIICNSEVVQDFGKVAEQLKRIGTAVETLNKCCAQMRASITLANRESGPLLEEANSLTSERQSIETKQRVLDAFNEHFHLEDDDLVTLTSTAEPINDDFFCILNRTKKIREDCKVLLGNEDQRLGLQILDHSGKQLNAGFQKLYRWLQREFKSVDLENPQISSAIRRALRVLAERPALFQNCLDAFADGRENSLSDAFYTALTGHSNDSDYKPTNKPIELFAHEPLRYVGDMFAWAHSTTVSEREALEVLFISQGDEIKRGIQSGLESEPWGRAEGDQAVFDGRQALNQIINRAFSGVARQIRQRVQQVIQSHEDPVLAYELSNLAKFYSGTFKRLLSEEAIMNEVLGQLSDAAFSQFKANMRDHVVAAQNDPNAIAQDLGPPEFLDDALDRVRALLKSYDSSFDSAVENDQGFQLVLDEALDPFLKICRDLTENLGESDADIFIINCYSATNATLALHSATAASMKRFEDTMNTYSTRIIELQHRYFLQNSGLEDLVQTLDETTDEPENLVKLAEMEPLQPNNLIATSQQLDAFLPSALMDAMQNIKQLHDIKLAQAITDEAAARFCDDFEMVESKILAVDELSAGDDEEGNDDDGEKNKHTELRDLFPRTVAEVNVLLS